MAEDNRHHSSLLRMGVDVLSLVADCSRTDGSSMYREFPNWDEWIQMPLKLMAEEGDCSATTILENPLTFSEPRAAVLGIEEELLGLILRKAPDMVRTAWLQAPLEDALG